MFAVSMVLFTIASDGAYALIVGLLLAKHWSDQRDGSSVIPILPLSRFRRLLIASAAVFALAHAAKPWFLAANMSGSTRWHDFAPLVPEILNQTHVGTLWYIDAVAIGVLLVAVILPASRFKVPANWSAIACLLVIGYVKAASGHAAGDGAFSLREVVQALHIFATGVWAGAVLVSGLFVLPQISSLALPSSVGLYGSRFSQTATGAIAVILISGIYAADRGLDNSLANLWQSTWGKVLSVKVLFVLVALGFGAYNRFILNRIMTTDDCVAFARGALAEATVMIVIVCLSGILGTLSPTIPTTY